MNGKLEEDLYTVVTIFWSGQSILSRQPVVHSYGPYTKGQADVVRHELISDPKYKYHVEEGRFTAHVTKVLDPENQTPFTWQRIL